MTEAFFEPHEPPDDPSGPQRFVARPACVGPWSPDAAHGGPPSALLVRACEEATRAAGGVGLTALRVAVEFLAPVPVGELELVARVVRAGRRITLAEADLRAAGRPVLQARTWLLEASPKATPRWPAEAEPPAEPEPESEAGTDPGADRAVAIGRHPDRCPPIEQGWDFPYGQSVQWRHVCGTPTGEGDAAVWARQRIPLIAGEEPSGLQRAVLVADSGSGLSAGLDWDRWSFVNVDLDVHLSRPLAGDWVLVDARSRYQSTGTGLATSVLHDLDGVVGVGAQTLMITPR